MRSNKIRIVIGCILALAGIFLISLSVATNLLQYSRKQEALAVFNIKQASAILEPVIKEKFGEDIVENAKNSVYEDGSNELPNTSYVLTIPKIDSREPVVEGTDKHSLSVALGHEPDTACPGECGNCVIAGHRNYTFGKYFNRLNEVEVGDMIYIDTPDETYSYKVSEIKTVRPDQVEILDDTDEEILTLYTCTPIYIATHRLVVIAERII